MSILWCGGEDIDFPNGRPPYVNTTAANFRGPFSRCALHPSTTHYVSKSTAFPGGLVTNFWLHSWMHYNAFSSQQEVAFVGVGKLGTTKGLWLMSSAMWKIELSTWDETTINQLAVSSSNVLSSSGEHTLDMHVVNFGASADVTVYVNGMQALTFSGNVTLTDFTNGVDCVLLSGFYPGTAYTYHSEFIVADEDTRTMGLATLVPEAAGDASQWVGTYDKIDEISQDDNDLIYVDADAQDELFNLSVVPTGSYQVRAARIVARATKGASSTVSNLKLGLKPSGGSIDVGSNLPLTGAWETKERIIHTLNGNPMTTAIMNDAQIVFRSAT